MPEGSGLKAQLISKEDDLVEGEGMIYEKK